MDPLTHAMTGWLLAQPLDDRRDRALVVLSGLAADADGLTLAFGREVYWRTHHLLAHNVFAGALIVAACAAGARRRLRTAALCAVSFHLHILQDLLGSGADWTISYLYPASAAAWRFSQPFMWEHNAWQNVAIAAALIGLVLWTGWRRGATMLELVSRRADREVIGALRARFGPPH